MSTRCTKRGSRSSLLIWCKYWGGEVSAIASGKARFPLQFVFRHAEDVDTVVGQLREEDRSGESRRGRQRHRTTGARARTASQPPPSAARRQTVRDKLQSRQR